MKSSHSFAFVVSVLLAITVPFASAQKAGSITDAVAQLPTCAVSLPHTYLSPSQLTHMSLGYMYLVSNQGLALRSNQCNVYLQ